MGYDEVVGSGGYMVRRSGPGERSKNDINDDGGRERQRDASWFFEFLNGMRVVHIGRG